MKKNIKHFLSLALALVMIIGMMPAGHIHAVDSEEKSVILYRWENDANGKPVSVEAGNGYIENEVKEPTSGIYPLTESITLEPNQNWVIRVGRESTEQTSTFVLSGTRGTDGEKVYLWDRGNIVGVGHLMETYWNSMVTASETGKVEYVIENRYDSESGTNTMYISFDEGKTFAPLTTGYRGGNVNASIDGHWYNGETLIIKNLGGDHAWKPHIDYVEIEIPHETCEFGNWYRNADDNAQRDCTVCGKSEIKEMTRYRWEKQTDGTPASVATGNGYTENGLKDPLSAGVYPLTDAVTLDPTQPWYIRVKRTSTERQSTFLLSLKSSAGTEGNMYLWDRGNIVGIGHFTTQYESAMVTATETGEVEYVIENRYDAQTQTNVIYISINGGEFAPLNKLYIAQGSAGTTTDWYNGETLMFNYLGVAGGHNWKDHIEYMEVGVGHVCEYGNWYINEDNKMQRDCECGDSEIQNAYRYRWEKQTDNTPASVGTGNGFVENKLDGASGVYALDTPVELDPTQPWTIVIERNATSRKSTFLLSATKSPSGAGNVYLWDRGNIIGFGHYTDSFYGAMEGYEESSEAGVALAKGPHKFVFENRYDAVTNTNTIYLSIDGADFIPVDTNNTGGKIGTGTNTWYSGETLIFNYLGVEGSNHNWKDHIEYMEIWMPHDTCEFGDWYSDENNQIARACSECGKVEIANYFFDYYDEEAGAMAYEGFENAADAFTFANGSGSIKLNQNVTVDGDLFVTGHLNLNNYILTAGNVTVLNGGSIIDNFGRGLLKTNGTLAWATPSNDHAAVWSESKGGYVMMNIGEQKTKTLVDDVNNTYAFYYQPALHASAIDALKAGHATSGIKICITVSWKVDGEDGSKKFYVGDELLTQYLDAYNEDGTPKLAFKLTLTGVENVEEGSLNITTSIEHLITATAE